MHGGRLPPGAHAVADAADQSTLRGIHRQDGDVLDGGALQRPHAAIPELQTSGTSNNISSTICILVPISCPHLFWATQASHYFFSRSLLNIVDDNLFTNLSYLIWDVSFTY